MNTGKAPSLANSSRSNTERTKAPTPDTVLPGKTEDKKAIDALLILSQITSAVSGLSELKAILKVGLEKTLEFIEGTYGGVCFWMSVMKGLPAMFIRV